MSPILAVTHDDDLVVVALTGEIDLSNASELEVAILEAVPNGAGGLVLDASQLGYLDSSGVRLLLSVAGRLSWRGQGFALASPAGSRCRRVLSLAGVEGAFPIEGSVPDATARLRADVGATEP
jgi:anti-anti-sigma factor